MDTLMSSQFSSFSSLCLNNDNSLRFNIIYNTNTFSVICGSNLISFGLISNCSNNIVYKATSDNAYFYTGIRWRYINTLSNLFPTYGLDNGLNSKYIFYSINSVGHYLYSYSSFNDFFLLNLDFSPICNLPSTTDLMVNYSPMNIYDFSKFFKLNYILKEYTECSICYIPDIFYPVTFVDNAGLVVLDEFCFGNESLSFFSVSDLCYPLIYNIETNFSFTPRTLTVESNIFSLLVSILGPILGILLILDIIIACFFSDKDRYMSFA